MKTMKRPLALMLLLCLLLSLTTPLVSAATGTLGRNTATRHTTCTELSSQAQAYYTSGQYDYETIAAQHGVYSTDSWTVTQNNPVYTALQTLMVETHTNQTVVYSGTGSSSLAHYWNYTDTVNGGNDYLLFYCDKLMANVQNTEGYSRTGMEREHVWCKSKGDFVEGSTSAGADLHHMRPSYGYINGVKSNRSFGNVEAGESCTLDGVSVFTYTSNDESGVMEVNDNIKGDIARILLYVYVRWGQPNLYSSYGSSIASKLKTAGVNTSGTINGSDDGTKIMSDLATLMEWMAIDPVDDWEMQRNDQIENVQGNRNVFIDYPEYAWIMFGMEDQMPSNMPTPSGMAMNGGSSASYAVTNVTVNNSSYGSAVITDGRTVTVTPNEGYYLVSATASSGTVAINGNIITVSNLTADATVNVTLARIPQCTVSLSDIGNTVSTVSVNQGSSMDLPTSASTVAGYTFLGWTVATVDPESATMPTILTGSYCPTQDITLNAVYSREYQNANPRPAGYSLSNEAPTAGENVIIARLVNGKYYALTTASNPKNQALTIENSVVTNTESVVWTVSSPKSGVSLKPLGGTNYLHMNTSSLSVQSGTSNAEILFISNADGSYKAVRADNQRWIVGSGLYGFGCSQNANSALSLYVFKYHDGESSATTYYTTNPTCAHEQTRTDGAVAATCTTDGYTGNTVCVDCGMIMDYGTTIYAPGHTVANDPEVAPTCTTAGKTAGTHCSVCQAILTAQTTVPMLGHSYNSSVVTSAATCTENGVKTYTCSRCQASYTEAISALGHSYGSAEHTGSTAVHTYRCQNPGCTHSYTESHDFNITTSGSIKTYSCKFCTYSYTSALDNYVITLNDRGATSLVNVTEGNSTVLPTAAGSIAGYTFAGWSASPILTEAASAGILTGSYTPNTSITLYAVYSRTEAGTAEASYSLVTNASELQSGRNLIIAAKDYDYAMGAIYSNYYRNHGPVTKNGNTLTPGNGVYLFTLGSGNKNGTWSLYDTVNNAYLTALNPSGTYYNLGTETELSSNGSFSFDIAPDGTAGITTNNGSCIVKYYKSTKYTEFKCVSSNTASDCYDCALYIETPASANITYYTTAPVEPTTYTVRYSALGVVGNTVTVAEGESITLPEAAAAADGYSFVGWSEQVVDPEAVSASILTGSYTPTSSVTLYAVYSRSEAGEGGTASLVKMTAEDSLAVGDKIVIVANGTDFILYQETKSGSYLQYREGASTLSAELVAGDDKYYLDVTGSDGAWILGDAANGYLYSDKSNNLACKTDNRSTWTLISNEDGTFYLTTNNRKLSCRTDLSTGNKNYWRLGGTGGSGSSKLDLYKYTTGSSSTTYYTTNPTGITACAHESATLVGVVDATCTQSGYSGDSVCNDCGETVSIGSAISPFGHSYNDGVITTSPTCTAAGVKTFTCSRCNDSYTEEAAALGHDLTNHAAQAATCTSIGWNDYQTCSRCSYTTYAEIAALGHSYNDGVITTSPTCTAAGVKTFTCSRCNDSYTEEAAALGHDLTIHAAQAATCTAIGWNDYQTCSRCSYTTYAEIAALGHSYNDGVITTSPTCTAAGVKTFTCSRCNDSYTEEITALGHDIIGIPEVPASCTECGYSAGGYCSRCDYSSEREEIPATGHSYNDNGICTCGEKLIQITSASLRLDGDIDVIYTATIPEGATASMTFTMNSTSVTVNGTDSFLFEGVNPQCMGDTISAALRVTVGGRTYTCTKDDYSVRQYCVNLLASENISAEIRTLISDLLAYGAAAQTYMSYKTDALVNVGADIVNPTYTSYTPISGLGAALSGTALTDTRWVSAGLTLTNSVAMRFRFYAENISGLSVKVTINGREQTFTQFTAVEGKENYYEIFFNGISAEEFADNVTASFCRSGAAIGSTLTYSVNAYVCAKQNAENTSLANLVKALYCYGVAAKAYGEIANP